MLRTAMLVLFALAIAIAVSAGSHTIAAPVPKDDNPDRTAMQGKWKLTEVAFNGEPFSADVAANLGLTWEIQGNVVVIIGQQHNHRMATTLKFDLVAKPRRLIFSDGKVTDLDGKPLENLDPDAGKRRVVIYKIGGDTLVIASLTRKEGVPEDFVGKAGTDTVTMTFTRVKK